MTETAILIIVVVLAAAGIIAYAVWFNKKLSSERVEDKQEVFRERRKSVKAVCVSSFIEPKVHRFYIALRQALPSQYVVFPSVCTELLFIKSQRSDLRLRGFYADMVVLTQTLKPVLVIDLIDSSLTGDFVHPLDDEAKDVIRNAGINILEYPIQENYGIDELRKAVAKAMNPLLQ